MPLGASCAFSETAQRAFSEGALVPEFEAMRAQARAAVITAQNKSADARTAANATLLERAKRLITSTTPAPVDAWTLLQRTKSVDALLADGATYFTLVALGVTLPQMLAHVTIADVRRLGCTYETLLAADMADALERGQLTIHDCLAVQPDARLLIGDGVIRTASVLCGLTPTQLHALRVVDFDVLVHTLHMDVATLAKFRYDFDTWYEHFGMKPSHLREMRFDPEKHAAQCSWDHLILRRFVATR